MSLLKYTLKLRVLLLAVITVTCCTCSKSPYVEESEANQFVEFIKQKGSFPLVENKIAAPILIDSSDFSGVIKVAKLFQRDIEMVTGEKPNLSRELASQRSYAIIVGTIGKNHFIDTLINQGKIDVTDVAGKWETSLIQVIDKPFEGLDKALVITGSDKRGTIYGMFDISRKIGVSPWYWWADVPVKNHKQVFIKQGRYNLGEPKVKYRGIFLNDEEPALGRWAVEKYGGFNHKFYEKVFELLLRQKGNYMWPAMWWASFNSNDTLNPKLADEFGIVMGTSHHEPLMRAHAEWKTFGGGEWNYTNNKLQLDSFWREGIERMGPYESIVTIGMRGDGDEAMEEGTNINLLESIVENQRQIIEEVTHKSSSETPQVWALYKEVQEYYEKGMKVPGDVTLLLCDDNWGNVRSLPDLNSPKRKGGYGMYYHFDYVGGPRNYKWINTNSLPRVWEQMNLTYQYGVDQIWIVNVGDLKPMELPISFFLDYAWNPEKIQPEDLEDYTIAWAKEQFGTTNAKEIARILSLYSKYNSRRKPESLDANTYSLFNYREFERVMSDYKTLANRTKELYTGVEDRYKDAFYQLVYYPVAACSNLYEMYYHQAKNQLYLTQGRAATNLMAEKVKENYLKDQELTQYFHKELADGKWNHMMAQIHIGYTSWQQPSEIIMPAVKEIDMPAKGKLKVAIEGSEQSWSGGDVKDQLLEFDSFNDQSFFIELFNTGLTPIDYQLILNDKCLQLSEMEGTIKLEKRLDIKVNWEYLENGKNNCELTILSSLGDSIKLQIFATKYSEKEIQPNGFIERNGYVSMEAPNFSKAINSEHISWKVIKGMGKTKGAVIAWPANRSVDKLSKSSPALEYDFTLLEKPNNENIEVMTYLSPTLNFLNGEGLQFAISIDDEEPQIINMHEDADVADWKYPDWWNNAVINNVIVKTSSHNVIEAGNHTLKYWMVSPGVVLQKLVIDNGGVKSSYLGAPQSMVK